MHPVMKKKMKKTTKNTTLTEQFQISIEKWAHKTSLIPLRFIEISVTSHGNEQ
jgi:hypothetical protein